MGNVSLGGIPGMAVDLFFRFLVFPANMLSGFVGSIMGPQAQNVLEGFYSVAFGSIRYIVGAGFYFICAILIARLYSTIYQRI